MLTERQQEILGLICQGIREDGMPPTRAEIAYMLGFSSANAAESHLRALERKGMIEILAGASRGICHTTCRCRTCRSLSRHYQRR